MLQKILNTLNKIKNPEVIKHKRRTTKQKELLNLFNDSLDIVLTDKTLKSESQEDKIKNKNEKEENEKVQSRKVESRKEKNEKVESKREEKEKVESKNKKMKR